MARTPAPPDTPAYRQGHRDGAAVHRGEATGYDRALFLDADYRKGLQDGRAAAIDEELSAGLSAFEPISGRHRMATKARAEGPAEWLDRSKLPWHHEPPS